MILVDENFYIQIKYVEEFYCHIDSCFGWASTVCYGLLFLLIILFSADEADGEVIDKCTEEANTLSVNGASNSEPVLEAAFSSLSELSESDQVDIEVQSPKVKTRG